MCEWAYLIFPSVYLVLMYRKGPGDLGSLQGCVVPKTQKIILDASLFNTQQYKVGIKGKVEQSKERK